MYVAELDRPWTQTHFLFQGFEITNDEILDDLKENCDYVYIDIEKGIDLNSNTLPRPSSTNIKTETSPEVEANLKRILKNQPVKRRWNGDRSTLEEELVEARHIETAALDVLYSTLEDVKLGRTIDSAATKAVIAGMVESIIRNPDAMIVLSQLKDSDEYTALHSLRVCILALTLGRHINLSEEELNLLGVGALLHDVGKMKVPSELLNKSGRLTDKEFEIVKNHVPIGVQILENAKGISPLSIEVAERHHERYDGGGYALGYKGDQIGTFGLIAGIVDCYDAITSDRSYHEGMSAYNALSNMYKWRDTAFQAHLIEQFIQCMGVYPIGSVVELTTGAIGVVATVNRERRLKPCVVLVLNSDKQPYDAPKTINLMLEAQNNPKGAPEIHKVLGTGEYDILPADYLPIKAI